VAALFAVHPLHVESVAWVAERKDVLSTLFWMLTLWSYVSYVRQPQWHRYMLVVVCFALGLLAKPMLVTLPFVLLLLDYWPLGRVTLDDAAAPDERGTRSSRQRGVVLRLLGEKTPLFALAAASSVATFVVQQHGGSVIRLELAPFVLRAENALVSYVAYIGKMLWPARLAAFYPYPPSLPIWQVIGAALILMAAFALALRAVRRYPYLLVGWLWYVGTLVPVIGLVQVGFQRMADRYTYIPLIGLFLIVAWGGSDLLRNWRHRRFVLAAAAGIVVAACAVTARGQVRTWENAVTLWQRDLNVTSGNFHAHKNLADALASRGKFDEAIPHYLEAVRLRPRYAEAHLRAGHVLFRTGRKNEAMAHYLDALSIRPDLEEAHNGLGVGLMEQGKDSEAIAHFMEGVRLKPKYADARHNLALALAKQGRRDEAIREMSTAVQIEPNEATWHYHLAALYRWRGDIEQARHHLERAVTLDPTDEVARRALRDLNVRSPQ
jgi:tetratricopeptide (TPR) repeat protein